MPRPGLTIRPFAASDTQAVRGLFVAVNRALAPAEMRAAFEHYITRSLAEEIDRIAAYYGERNGGFWVATSDGALAGTFGLEPGAPGAMELRRMYVAPEARRQGIARIMLCHAEDETRRRGYKILELSTSELQPAAVALYHAARYDLVREGAAIEVSNKTVGGGIHRFYFKKTL